MPFYSNNFTLSVILLLALGVSGCGKELQCAISGDNVSGHVVFGDYMPIQKGSRIHIEASTDDFATIDGSNTVTNVHGLITVSYSLCASSDKNLTFRAFQDMNGNDLLELGELSGDHGKTEIIHSNTPTKKLTGIDIILDTP